MSRAESQAQTREEILNVAEKLFLDNGYHATSISTIAAEAGRTIGAIYSNYASKEDLCLEVIKRRVAAEASSLVGVLGTADPDPEARIAATSQWWGTLNADTAFLTLVAEYGITVLQSQQRAGLVESAQRTIETTTPLIKQFIPEELQTSPDFDDALHSIVATASGLSGMRMLGLIDQERSVHLLTRALRIWLMHSATA
jgi:AcrR family transcriptional regulator